MACRPSPAGVVDSEKRIRREWAKATAGKFSLTLPGSGRKRTRRMKLHNSKSGGGLPVTRSMRKDEEGPGNRRKRTEYQGREVALGK